MKVLVVDTNALIDLFDGDQEVAAVISSAEKVWIAAGVLETGSVLLSRDRHFSNIPMIRRAC